MSLLTKEAAVVRRFAFVVALLLLTSSLIFAAVPEPKDVDITAPDGLKLKATYYSAGKPGPGVLLLHMCNTDRKSWAPLAPQLANAGINVLTVDNRGFGESGAVPADDTEQQAAIRKKWPADFDTVFGYLLSQPGVDNSRIGIGGGSCGVNNALQTARRHPEQVRSLVLLAGPTDGDGITFLRKNPWLPVFTSAAADDQYDAEAPQLMKWLSEISGNPRNKFMGFNDGKHGTEIFPVHPELPRAITDWFVQTLVTSPADPKAAVKVKHTPVTEFWAALDAPGGLPNALNIYHQTKKKDSRAILFPESMLNITGYSRLQAGKTQDAIELFKLNAEAYPNSANVYDSLADGYLAAGDNAKALEAEKTALAKLPGDRNNEQFKTALRKAAEEKVKKLEPAAKKE